MRFTKKIPLALVAISACTSLFSYEFFQKKNITDQVVVADKPSTKDSPAVKNPYDCFVSFDVLYWLPKVSQTDFAVGDTLPMAAPPFHISGKAIDFKWDWGFRVGLGHIFQHDRWELGLEYTYFNTNSNGSLSTSGSSYVIPLTALPIITYPDAFTYCSQAKSSFNFKDQALDLLLGKKYRISDEFCVKPRVGLTSLWIDLQQTTYYTGGSPGLKADEVGLGINTVKVKNKGTSWGMGPRFGLDTLWELDNGFSIFANASGALIYTFFKNSQSQNYSAIPTNTFSSNISSHQFVPMSQIALGLKYESDIYDDKQHIEISLGYEVEYFWRQNQIIKAYNSGPYSEDVSLHGVTGRFRWDF